MTLVDAELGKEYIVTEISVDDDELIEFLFTLGCYSGEKITVVSNVSKSFVVSIKDGRYNLSKDLAETICVTASGN